MKLFWKLFFKYYSDLSQVNYYCQSFKCKLSSKDKVDYLLEKSPELEINFKKRVLIQEGIIPINT